METAVMQPLETNHCKVAQSREIENPKTPSVFFSILMFFTRSTTIWQF